MTPTSEQQKIYSFVKYDSNHGIIDAVAGSGKTTTIVESANHIDKSKNVLFCAFNNSIAKEISNKFFQKGLHGIQVKTLHALGYDILKVNAIHTTYNIDNNKYDKIIQLFIQQNINSKLIKELCEINKVTNPPESKSDEYQLKNFVYTIKGILFDICNKYRLTLTKKISSNFKEMLLHFNIFNGKKSDSETFTKEANIYFEITQFLIDKGNQLAKISNTIDFADMLYLPFENKLTPINKFDILFIDECQDLSRSQLAVALKYVKNEGRVLAVGDPFQSIYGFTGADINSFDSFKKLPNKEIVTLTLSSCFRCPTNVIELAQHFRSDIHAFKPKEGIINKIEFDEVIENIRARDLVICRTKAPVLVLMFKLLEASIDVEVHEDEIKEFINDLRFLFSQDELNETHIFKGGNNFFESVKDRNISFAEKRSQKLQDKEEREKYIVEETHLIQSKLNFIQKQMVIHTETKTINSLLKKIESLISGAKNAVKLSTIHRAKGLENDRVFILDYDKLPLYRNGQKDWEKKQENNLKYVALTRAKHTLFLVNSEKIITVEDEGSLFDSMEIW